MGGTAGLPGSQVGAAAEQTSSGTRCKSGLYNPFRVAADSVGSFPQGALRDAGLWGATPSGLATQRVAVDDVGVVGLRRCVGHLAGFSRPLSATGFSRWAAGLRCIKALEVVLPSPRFGERGWG